VKVAYYSPLPPERSGIADYSALLVPALRERIDVLVAQRGKRKGPRGADLALYHVGNDPDAHGWIVDALRREPGVVVLHDFVLHHLVAGITLGRKDGHGYLDAMERDAGVVGRLLAHGVLDKRIPPLWETRPADFPLTRELLAHATGLVVHSRYVGAKALEAGFQGPVWRIPHPAWPVGAVRPVEIEGDPLFGCFGHLNASKRIPQLLEAFARVHREQAGARLLLAGAVAPRFELERRLEALPAETRAAVIREDYAPEERLNALIARADVCVSLRAPTMGETSGVVLRALSLGRPLVVSDLGWFAELPDEVALKVPVDEHEAETLAAELALLAAEPGRRAEMAAAARRHAETEHELGHVADLYAAALEEAAGGPVVREQVLGEVARAAADVGIEADDPLAAEIAQRLREVRVAE
jgi:glycosyltransferase involved in cell wall biosynthesis